MRHHARVHREQPPRKLVILDQPSEVHVGRRAGQLRRHSIQQRTGDDEVDRRQTLRHSGQQLGVQAMLHNTHIAHDRATPPRLHFCIWSCGSPEFRIDGVEEDAATVAEPDLPQRLLTDADDHVGMQTSEPIPFLHGCPPRPWIGAPVVDHVDDEEVVRQTKRNTNETWVRDEHDHRPVAAQRCSRSAPQAAKRQRLVEPAGPESVGRQRDRVSPTDRDH